MRGGRKGQRIGHVGERHVREEAVVEEAALKNEVDQGIEGVPYEEEAMTVGRLLVESLEG